MLLSPGESQPKDVQLKGFSSLFLFPGFVVCSPSISVSSRNTLLFQITAAITPSEPAPDIRMCFLSSLPLIQVHKHKWKVKEKPSTVYAATRVTTLPPEDAALPCSKSTWDRGGHQVRCFLNSSPSNNTQTKRSESGGPTLAYAHLFMKTLSVDLVSSWQSSRGACLFKSVSSQVKFVALMNGRAESSIKGQRKITLICIQ